MADEPLLVSKMNVMRAGEKILTASKARFLPPSFREAIRAQAQPRVTPATPMPAPAPPAAAVPALPVVPAAPGSNPFDTLPFPAPGDRIKADDFKNLSRALQIVADMTVLSGLLFGEAFGDAKLVLATQGYHIFRVMSVFGAEIDDLDDASLDGRKVIHVLPVAMGDRRTMVVVTEAVDTRRFVPNLMGLTYAEAQERTRALIGDVPLTGAPPTAPPLVGRTLAEAQQALNR